MDSCLPGDVVHLTGTVGLLSADGSSRSSGAGSSSSWPTHRRGSTMYSLLLDVNSMIRYSGRSSVASQSPYGGPLTSAGSVSGGHLVVTSLADENGYGDGEAKSTELELAMSSLGKFFGDVRCSACCVG